MLSKPSPRRILSFLTVLLAAGAWQVHDAQAQSNAWARKMFNKTKHDFGVVARGSDVQYRFKIKNIYKQTVHIADVKTTCGCSAASPTKRTLKTFETSEVVVTMNTQRFSRRKDTNLIVTFDRPLYAKVTIPITAYIRTDVVITPGSVNFGAVDEGTPAEKTISITYAGRSNWKINKVKIGNRHLTAKLTETNRRGGRVQYSLTLQLDGSVPVGSLRDQITLVTDDANSPYVPVRVLARVESEFTATASSLGTVQAGQPKVFNVVVRGRKSFQIEKIDCTNSPDCFQAKISEQSRRIHVVPVTFTPPEKEGLFRETLNIKIAGRDQPVTLEISGRIATN